MAEKVALVVGSKNDLPYLDEAKEILEKFGVAYEVFTLSAHRNLDATAAFARNAEKNGFSVIVACAGMAAALPGVLAAKTILPVIGVPLPSSEVKGMDSLLSIVQMPSGIPVATMAIGKPGVKNAALFSVAILAGKDRRLKEELKKYRESLK